MKLTTTQEETLVKKLQKMAIEADEFRSGWEDMRDEYWEMYLAQSGEQKDYPWPGASDFKSPMITVAVDSLNSLIYDAMFAQPPAVIASNDPSKLLSELLSKFYFGFVFKKHISLPALGNDWNFATMLDGTSSVFPRYSKDVTLVRREELLPKVSQLKLFPNNPSALTSKYVVETVSGYRAVERIESIRDDRVIIDVQDMARLWIAPGTKCGVHPAGNLQYPNCPWYFVEQWWSEDVLAQRKRQGFDYIDDELKAHLSIEDQPNREMDQEEEEGLGPGGMRKAVRCWVFFMRQVMGADYTDEDGNRQSQSFDADNGVAEEVVVWYFPDTKHVSRIAPLVYVKADNRRPHIDNRWVRIGNFFYGQGVPSKLRHVWKLYNSAINQQLDFGTLQNLPFFFYSPSVTGQLPQMHTLRPGQGVPVNDTRGIQMASFTGNPQFWSMMENIAQQWSERLTHVTDFAMGKSSALPNAPRSARGTAQLLGQAGIAFSHHVALLAEPYVEMFRQVHALYQRNSPEEFVFDFFDQSAGVVEQYRMSRNYLMEDLDFRFELSADKMLEREKAQQLFGLISAIPYLAQNPYAMREMARDVYASFGELEKFERIWPAQMPVQPGQNMGGGPAGGQQPAGLGPLSPAPPQPGPPTPQEAAA